MNKRITVTLTEDQFNDLFNLINGWLEAPEWLIAHGKAKEATIKKVAFRKRLLTTLVRATIQNKS